MCFIISPGARVFYNAYFGQGFGPIFLDDLLCTGRETRIIDCPRSTSTGVGDIDFCRGHLDDAGLRCVAGTYVVHYHGKNHINMYVLVSYICTHTIIITNWLHNYTYIHTVVHLTIHPVSFHSLSWWRHSIGWWNHWQWGSCGGLREWTVGHCVWWLLGSCRCTSCLQTARFFCYWYVVTNSSVSRPAA